MKILIVCQYYYPENFVISKIAKTLQSFGHEVSVLTGKPNYGYGHVLPEYKKVKYEIIDGVEVFRVKIHARGKSRLSIIHNYLSFWAHAKRFARHIDKKFDVVYSMSLSPVISIAPAIVYAKKHKVRHVLHCLDLWPASTVVTNAVKEGSLFYKVLYKWSRHLYKQCDEILVSSPSFSTYFSDVLDLPTNNIKYVPQPPIVSECLISPIKYESGTNIVFCGNVGSIQLIEHIPEAMNMLKDKTDIVFHIIGMGSGTKVLLDKIKEYGLEKRVIYYGPMAAKNASAYFVNCDAFYLALKDNKTVGETIPSKVMMYMAFAKPIIAMIQGDARTLLNKAGGAILLDENVDSLELGLLKFAQMSKEERTKLSKLNSDYYKENFELERLTHLIESELASKK